MEWRAVPQTQLPSSNTQLYEASSDGRVRNAKTLRELSFIKEARLKRARVKIGNCISPVEHIIAGAFLGWEPGKRIEHVNGDLKDCRVENLRVLCALPPRSELENMEEDDWELLEVPPAERKRILRERNIKEYEDNRWGLEPLPTSFGDTSHIQVTVCDYIKEVCKDVVDPSWWDSEHPMPSPTRLSEADTEEGDAPIVEVKQPVKRKKQIEWRPVKHPRVPDGYEASDNGFLRNASTGIELEDVKETRERTRVNIRGELVYVDELIASAFHGWASGPIRHSNGVVSDNRARNLHVCTIYDEAPAPWLREILEPYKATLDRFRSAYVAPEPYDDGVEVWRTHPSWFGYEVSNWGAWRSPKDKPGVRRLTSYVYLREPVSKAQHCTSLKWMIAVCFVPKLRFDADDVRTKNGNAHDLRAANLEWYVHESVDPTSAQCDSYRKNGRTLKTRELYAKFATRVLQS